MTRIATLTVVAALFTAAVAAAQDPVSPSDSKTLLKTDSMSDPKSQQTIEVIGDRVKDLQQTPATGFDVPHTTLEQRRVSSIQDLTRELPNISSTDGGAPGVANVYSARGLVNGAFFAGPSLCVYVDDIPFGDPFTYHQPLGTLDSAQVMLGPQFPTFGHYPYGGVINIVTRRPTDTLEGGAYGEGGNHGMINTGGYLMGALIPGQLRFRVGVDEESFGGVLYNSFSRKMDDSIYRIGGNFSLFYTPTPDWDIAFVSDVHKYENGAPRENALNALDPYVTSSDFQGRSNLLSDQEAIRVGYKVTDHLQFLSVTARRSFNIDPADVDLDFTSVPGNLARILQNETIASQEFRLKSDDSHSLVDWSAGVYGHLKNNFQSGEHGITGFGVNPNDFHSHEHWASIFADTDYKATKKLHLRLGARFDYVSETTVSSSQPFHGSDNFSEGSFKVGADYEVTDNAILFVDGGRAFKPGGFSAFAQLPAEATFQSEKNWFVEAGEKSTFLDGKLKVNGSVFYYDVSDYQLERATNGGFNYFVINVHSAHSMGAEGEIRGEVLPHIELFAQGGLTRILMGNYSEPPDPQTGFPGATFPAGAVAPFVPRYTGVLGASADCQGAFAHVEWVATGTVHYSDLIDLHQANYGQLNGGLGYGGDHWKATVFATNLNNRFFWTNMVDQQPFGTNLGSPSLPRELGIRLDVTF